jgi:hypothetical protein
VAWARDGDLNRLLERALCLLFGCWAEDALQLVDKARCKSPFLALQLSVFSALANYGVVKITRSYSEVVLLTTKHTMIYPGSGPSLDVIALSLVV